MLDKYAEKAYCYLQRFLGLFRNLTWEFPMRYLHIATIYRGILFVLAATFLIGLASMAFGPRFIWPDVTMILSAMIGFTALIAALAAVFDQVAYHKMDGTIPTCALFGLIAFFAGIYAVQTQGYHNMSSQDHILVGTLMIFGIIVAMVGLHLRRRMEPKLVWAKK